MPEGSTVIEDTWIAL